MMRKITHFKDTVHAISAVWDVMNKLISQPSLRQVTTKFFWINPSKVLSKVKAERACISLPTLDDFVIKADKKKQC